MKVTTIPVGMIGTNCHILQSEQKSCAVIDPGAQGEKLIQFIETEGLSVRYVLLTHGHYDHIGAVKMMLTAFPEALLYIGEADIEMLGDGQKSLAVYRTEEDARFIVGNAHGLCEGESLDMDELKLEVLETPGHTRGGVTYLCGDAMFAGDTLFYENVGRTDLYGGDYDTLLRSLQKLANLKGDYVVYTGHGPQTTLEHERRHNYYIGKVKLG